jgi:hypothetical protein
LAIHSPSSSTIIGPSVGPPLLLFGQPEEFAQAKAHPPKQLGGPAKTN